MLGKAFWIVVQMEKSRDMREWQINGTENSATWLEQKGCSDVRWSWRSSQVRLLLSSGRFIGLPTECRPTLSPTRLCPSISHCVDGKQMSQTLLHWNMHSSFIETHQSFLGINCRNHLSRHWTKMLDYYIVSFCGI